jgi:hypothetical protein
MTSFIKSKIGLNIVVAMIALVFTLLLPPSSRLEAGFSPTIQSQSLSSDDLDLMKTLLEKKKVFTAFEYLGYDLEEIKARMAGLSDDEISLLAGNLQNTMVPAGDGGAVWVVLLSLVVLCLLVIVINYYAS